LDDELSPSSTEEEDSSAEGSAEAEELSSPHAANSNAEKINTGRNFLHFMRPNIDLLYLEQLDCKRFTRRIEQFRH
jgi:hypothetical protein